MLRICFAVGLTLSPVISVAEVSGRINVIDGDTFDVGTTRVRDLASMHLKRTSFV
jgi:hypothetical protein